MPLSYNECCEKRAGDKLLPSLVLYASVVLCPRHVVSLSFPLKKKKRSYLFYPETGKFKLLCPEGFLVLENFAQNRAETPDSFREILHKCLLTKTKFAFIINLL